MLLMVLLIGTRHILLQRVFHRLRVLTTLRPFLLSLDEFYPPCTLPCSFSVMDSFQMDVKSAFLHGHLDEEIYMEQLQGFVQDYFLVCILWRSLYGLKQAPRAWYEKMDSFLLASLFTRCHFDPIVYIQHHGDDLLILVLYVDDLIIIGSLSSMIQSVQ